MDVVIVGAGFAGMYMLHKLRGQGMTARVFELFVEVFEIDSVTTTSGAKWEIHISICDAASFTLLLAFRDNPQSRSLPPMR